MVAALIKILLVDDNVPLRSAVRLLLRTEPSFHLVAETGDGATAVRLAAELSPDVILMDVNMPGELSGVDATRHIAASSAPENPAPVVIGFSASGDHTQAMLDAGAAAFIAKDRAGELIQNIKAALQH